MAVTMTAPAQRERDSVYARLEERILARDQVGASQVFYDLVKVSTIRLAYAMAEELYPHNVASIALTPGFMRTEWMLDHFKATEDNWREVAEKNAEARRMGFIASETPCFVGRAVAALAAIGTAAAQRPHVSTEARNEAMQITRSGTQPSGALRRLDKQRLRYHCCG